MKEVIMKNFFLVLLLSPLFLLPLVMLAMCHSSSDSSSNGKDYYRIAQSHFEQDLKLCCTYQNVSYSDANAYMKKDKNARWVAVKFNYQIEYEGVRPDSSAIENGVCYSIFSRYDIDTKQFQKLQCSMCFDYLFDDSVLKSDYNNIMNGGSEIYSEVKK